ncbi:monooxygenase [Glaciihabitans arcticus]|uniref:Monooxygenase n=1 Tax=Glaciihabitans arcticus TaxID=2668039 RepID=A0A4Q9GTC5_9MICO|nr:monooxygenase [Glaciihabitans arcticus]
METLSTSVVIVGAGPTGLMLATCLARLGVPYLILDRKSGPTRESRAVVLHSRTLEILDQLGLADRVLAEATVASAFRPGYRSTPFRRINLRALAEGTTPYPHLYVLEQSRTEAILGERLRELGGSVLWEHGVDGVEETTDGVRVTASEISIEARYLVGADGSASPVRELAGIAFEGRTNEHTFYVMDGHGVRGLDPEVVNVRLGERDFLLTFPMGAVDHARLIGVVPTGTGVAIDEADARLAMQRAFGVSYEESPWFSTYRVHHKVARDFRAGSILLAGDSAHVHSPVGAQGMNTGLQDAHNLACKLADVFTGRAPDSYLDRYAAERRPVALRLVSTTDRVFGAVTSDRLAARFGRRWVLRFVLPVVAATVPRLRGSARIFEYLSQTRIHYWMTPGAHGKRGVVVGRRLPWNGDNHESLRAMAWQVHAYGAAPEVDLDLPVERFPLVRNKRLVDGMLYLVRPDGFVAASATADDAAAVFARSLPRP